MYAGAFGEREIGSGVEMTLDTVCWIASMTKAVTSVCAMQLVEQGRLSLDAPLVEVLLSWLTCGSSKASMPTEPPRCARQRAPSPCATC